MERGFTGEGSLGVHQGVEDHLIGGHTGQEEVFAGPIDQVADRHMGLVDPEEAVEIVAEAAGTELQEEHVFLHAALTGPLGQAALAAGELLLVPERPTGARLALVRDQQVAPGFGDAAGHGLGGFGDLANCLVLLGLSEIQLQLVIDDVLPGAAIGQGVEEVFEAGLIGSQEDEGIGELAGAVASALQAGGGPLAGRTELDAAAVGVLRRQEHQPGGWLIGHGTVLDRCGMEAGEVAPFGGLLGKAGVEFGR